MRRALLLVLLACLGASAQAALPLPSSDAFGYQAASVPLAWNDISGTGDPVTAWVGTVDDGSALLNLPFNFRFYGAPYNKVNIASNGYLQFGSASSFYGTNCLSANQDPRAVAALYWMDLNPGLGGAVYTQVQGAPGSRVAVIQFQAVPRNVGGGTVTAQWLLYEASNDLRAQYLSTASSGSGIDAVAGLRSNFDCPNRGSLPLSCLQAVLTDSLAVHFSYPAVEPACGTPTETPSHTVSPTLSASPSITATFSESPTYTATPSISASPSISPSPSETLTATPSPSISPTQTDSPTASPSPTLSASFSASPSLTVTLSATPSPSATQTPLVLTDAFGYQAVFGPLAWEDISGTGQAVTAWAGTADDGFYLLDLPAGFNFRYYGADYNKVSIGSNGYLQFGATSAAFGYTCLGGNGSPAGIAALFWMDLDPGSGGSVLWEVRGSAPNRRLLVQYQAVPNQTATGTLSAQAVLFEGGDLSLRYLSSASLGDGNAAAAGLRSLFDCPNRTGLSVSCSQPLLGDGTQVDIRYPALEPACGTPTSTSTATASPSPTATPSATPSASPSHSDSPTATASATETPTPTSSPSFSVSPTATPTASITPTFSASPSFSHSPTITETATISPTFSVSPTATETATISPTFSVSPTFSDSPTATESFTVSPTFSVSPTVTESFTESPTFSHSPSTSPSPSISPTLTASPTRSASPTATPTATRSATSTATPSATPTGTRTVTPTSTATSSFTASPTATATLFPPATKPACLVLGQPDFSSSVLAAAGQASLSSPGGVAMDTRSTPYKVYVADTAHHRILFWTDASGLASGQMADGVVGQADFSAASPNRGGLAAADSLRDPMGLSVDPNTGDLWVADSGNHRVLRFAYPLALSGAAATRVLGQGGSFSSAVDNLGGVSGASLSGPMALSFDAFGRLAVADSGNHRVLRYSAPLSGSAADAVWGQANYGGSSPNHGGGVDAGGFNGPRGVQFNAGELWVADSGNHRILRFSTAPVLTGTADVVLGQGSFSTSASNQGFSLPNETRLSSPLGLGMDGAGRLMVADSGNHRVVAFEPPYDNFADRVWGQANIGAASAGTGQDQMSGPQAVAAAGAALIAADSANHRLLLYGCGAGLQASTPTSTPTVTPTRTPSFTESPTATLTGTLSPSFTASPSFSHTPTRSFTLTRTPTPSITPTGTISPTHTRTPTPSITLTLSPAPTLTFTLTPVPTETPYPATSDRILAFPNPAARDSGRICLAFPADPAAKLHIYDRLAQPVVVLSAQTAPGLACWDLRNSAGDSVAAGQYYVRVQSGGQAYTGKLTLR